MKKTFLIILGIAIITVLFFSNTIEVKAACTPTPCAAGTICIPNPLCANNFTELIDNLTNIIFYVAMLIAPVFLVVAGFYYLTAAANPEKVNTAKSIIIWTLVGLIVIIASKGIIALFQTITTNP